MVPKLFRLLIYRGGAPSGLPVLGLRLLGQTVSSAIKKTKETKWQIQRKQKALLKIWLNLLR